MGIKQYELFTTNLKLELDNLNRRENQNAKIKNQNVIQNVKFLFFTLHFAFCLPRLRLRSYCNGQEIQKELIY